MHNYPPLHDAQPTVLNYQTIDSTTSGIVTMYNLLIILQYNDFVEAGYILPTAHCCASLIDL